MFLVKLFLVGLFAASFASVISAQNADEISALKQATEAIVAKLQRNLVQPSIVGNGGENELLTRLERIEDQLIDAAKKLEEAALSDSDHRRRKLFKQACSLLKQAAKEAEKGKRFSLPDSLFFEIFDEVLVDIERALEDNGCKRYSDCCRGEDQDTWQGKRFRATYTTERGRRIRHTLELDGSTGWYRTDSGHGRFYDISYFEQGRVAKGHWRYSNGETGWFVFELNRSANRFSGRWGYGNTVGERSEGSWSGRR